MNAKYDLLHEEEYQWFGMHTALLLYTVGDVEKSSNILIKITQVAHQSDIVQKHV